MSETTDDFIDYDDAPGEFFVEGPNWLVKQCMDFKHPKIKSICKQFKDNGSISIKQQWVLAYYLASDEP